MDGKDIELEIDIDDSLFDVQKERMSKVWNDI